MLCHPQQFFFFFSPSGLFGRCNTKWKEGWSWEQISTNSFTRRLDCWYFGPFCQSFVYCCAFLRGVVTLLWIPLSAARETADVATCSCQLQLNNEIGGQKPGNMVQSGVWNCSSMLCVWGLELDVMNEKLTETLSFCRFGSYFLVNFKVFVPCVLISICFLALLQNLTGFTVRATVNVAPQ